MESYKKNHDLEREDEKGEASFSKGKRVWNEIAVNIAQMFKSQKFEAIQLKACIESYIKVSYKRFSDEIPHEIVSILKKNMEEELNSFITDEDVENIFAESRHVTDKRLMLKNAEKSLTYCKEILDTTVLVDRNLQRKYQR